MSTLSEHPVLFLAVDNLSKMSSIDEKQLSTIWNLFTKCKDNLENGRRLENISWRLWYRSTHFPVPNLENKPNQMSTSFSKVLSAPFQKVKSNKENLPPLLMESLDDECLDQSINLDNSQAVGMQHTFQQDQVVPVTEIFMNKEKELLEEIENQEMMMEEEASRESFSCPNIQKKATFFLSDSCEESTSIEMMRHIEMKRHTIGEDDETEFSEEYDEDGFSYSTDWSWSPSPLFSKIPLHDLKEPIVTQDRSLMKSQLSCALNTKIQIEEVAEESMHSHLSSSMKQTLLWDRCMPFNTKYAKDRPIKEDWRNDDTAEYW